MCWPPIPSWIPTITSDNFCNTTTLVCAPNPYTIGTQVIFVPKNAASFWTSYKLDELVPGLGHRRRPGLSIQALCAKHHRRHRAGGHGAEPHRRHSAHPGIRHGGDLRLRPVSPSVQRQQPDRRAELHPVLRQSRYAVARAAPSSSRWGSISRPCWSKSPNLLSAEQVAHIRGQLAATNWVDGKVTAGAQSAGAKHNLQVPEDAPAARALGEIILSRAGPK